jgi:hypothetical protein
VAERTRTFTGTLPDTPAHEAWQKAHDRFCEEPGVLGCGHTNPYPETTEVLTQVFEDERPDDGLGAGVEYQIVGVHVAIDPNGSPIRRHWGRPAEMTEEA